ncbi:MAG: methyltransferase [Firmicutes bacterium HGW-Firmicutes-2]|jgi:DNA-binding transcriptional MerR regulator/ubiquinone/menaquinone biosynthesis C-methylase UbiE|nr:MAG: methyltransferase [Firmicutes bacterium HGW-Firmicutes-2]
MRIGQFAVENNTSIDTIRHYMSMGLLVPEKRNAQYDFDESCTQDFHEIAQLKKIGFTLSEIQHLILYRRIGKLTGYDRRMTYTSFFEKKKEQIELELNRLNKMKHNLNNEIIEMRFKLEEDQAVEREIIGMNISSLELFACPVCQASFEITKGNIQHGILISATLTCQCNYEMRVEEGIVYTPDITLRKHEEKEDTEDAEDSHYSESFIDEYINTTDIEYLKKIHTGLRWSSRHIPFALLEKAIILELGSGHGYFMRHMLDQFPEISTYIAVDHDPVKMMWLKKIIERSHPKCKVIFICADFTQVPLKNHSVDMLLDMSGSSNYAFEHTDFLLDKIDHLLKKNALIHGGYIVFENFVSQSKIPMTHRKGFSIRHIQSQLKALNYECLDEFISEPVDKGGPQEDYFVDGEQVRTYFYNGKKSIKPLG